MTTDTERLVPEVILCSGEYLPVQGIRAYPHGQHPSRALLVTTVQTAVEVVTANGSRWFGFDRAWIGSDLRMHVDGYDARNEVIAGWDRPEE